MADGEQSQVVQKRSPSTGELASIETGLMRYVRVGGANAAMQGTLNKDNSEMMSEMAIFDH